MSERAAGLEDTVRAQVARVHDRIRAAGGQPDAVTLVAVTKGFGLEEVIAARRAGCTDLGENYAQELEMKASALAGDGPSGTTPPPRWHFLGRLQTNKVRKLAPVVAMWQSVDRHDLITEIATRAPGAAILVQVNLSEEPQKGGCSFDEVPALVDAARRAGLDARGLMGVGTAGDPDRTRSSFRRLVAVADELVLPVRSIGMTDDLELAIEEGSTMVRVGRALFGPRPARP